MNGPSTHPLYKFLKHKSDHTEIGWNFEKFLVIDGIPIRRYRSNVNPKAIEKDILPYLVDSNTNEEL